MRDLTSASHPPPLWSRDIFLLTYQTLSSLSSPGLLEMIVRRN